MFIGADDLRRGFDNISQGKENTQTHSPVKKKLLSMFGLELILIK